MPAFYFAHKITVTFPFESLSNFQKKSVKLLFVLKLKQFIQHDPKKCDQQFTKAISRLLCLSLSPLVSQIVALTFALAVNARPQEYDDYDQPARPAARLNQKQQQQQPSQKRNEERETSTWIPIIQYDKEQDISGSYKTQ
jgi:hypothetical protein